MSELEEVLGSYNRAGLGPTKRPSPKNINWKMGFTISLQIKYFFMTITIVCAKIIHTLSFLLFSQ